VLSAVLLSATFQGQPTEKIQEYLALAQATLQNPITPQELREAVLSEKGIAAITEIFKQSIAESLVLKGTVVTPELGGEATLSDGGLNLIQYRDPIHPSVRRLVELTDDPAALLDLLNESEDGRNILKTTGGLHAHLYQLTQKPPSEVTESQRAVLESIVLSTVSIHFKTWSADPETQSAGIESNEWRGRYVGFWHIHPPRWGRQGLVEGIEPSMADMTNAVQMGQFVTIVFQPEGFDFYDLSLLSLNQQTDISSARVISHRSPGWSREFESLFHRRTATASNALPELVRF
jgi:hypothetical protein